MFVGDTNTSSSRASVHSPKESKSMRRRHILSVLDCRQWDSAWLAHGNRHPGRWLALSFNGLTIAFDNRDNPRYPQQMNWRIWHHKLGSTRFPTNYFMGEGSLRKHRLDVSLANLHEGLLGIISKLNWLQLKDCLHMYISFQAQLFEATPEMKVFVIGPAVFS